MKYKMKSKDLLTKEDIWNAVIHVLGEYDFPTENEIAHEAMIVFYYYSELESGGHESLLNSFSWYIEDVGITNYLNELIGSLEKISAYDFSLIEKEYGKELWRLFKALESAEIEEDEFYKVVEKADIAYNKLNDKLGVLLEAFFIKIHTELIEVIED